MRKPWTVPFLSLAIAIPLHAADAPPRPPAGQSAQSFEKHITMKLDYLLFVPSDYNRQTDKKWPLILFLHGSGERGTDINMVKTHGPPKKAAETEPNSPAKQFIIVSPQCPPGRWWKADELSALLDDVVSKYDVDVNRVYLTGISMGGFGTWDLATSTPERFAAIAPICGGGEPDLAPRLKSLPIWIFHGDADTAVTVQHSEEMFAALEKVKADVKFTKYPGVGHDCWTRTYDNPELYAWFLSHHRGEKPGATTGAGKPADAPKGK